MKRLIVSNDINQPEVMDYENAYPRVLCNTPKKQSLFEIITQPDNILSAITVAEETGSSPVAVYETKIAEVINRGEMAPLERHEKQFVGTVTAVVMEANGWCKTGKKQRFSKGLFKSAELYIKQVC